MQSIPFRSDEVSEVFQNYPEKIQEKLQSLRYMIYDVAEQIEGVGELEETLKWGQISYLTPITKSGSTIRMDALPDENDGVALYFNCQTTLVETFRTIYGDTLEFEGNRCVKLKGDIPTDAVRHCIELALTYHLNKKRQRKSATTP